MKVKQFFNKLLLSVLILCIIASLFPVTNVLAASTETNSFTSEEITSEEDTKSKEPQLGTIVANVTPDPIPAFSDVKKNNWAYPYVQYVRAVNYFSGVGNNMFAPKKELTKAEIIQVLYQVAKADEKNAATVYSDIKSSHYAFNAIYWAHKNQLAQILQKNTTTFSPKTPVTRVKIAELLWNFAKTQGWASNSSFSVSIPTNYTDIASVSSEQKKAIRWCYYCGIMRGKSETSFAPNDTLTRAEMATICYALDYYVTHNHVFCVGTSYEIDGIDTTKRAQYARDCFQSLGYAVVYSDQPTVKVMQNSHNLGSQIVSLNGHGNKYGMYFDYLGQGNNKTGVYYDQNTTNSDGYQLAGIQKKMRLVDVAIFAGCQTAEGNDNLACRACRFGAKVALGWEQTVDSYCLTKWSKGFYGYLAKGYSVSAALWEMGFADIATDSGVFDWKVYVSDPSFFSYESLNLPSQHDASMLVNSVENEKLPEDLLKSYPGSTLLQGENVAAEVANILGQIVEDFRPEDYRVYYHDHGLGLATIHYVRLVEGFETDSRYSACVQTNTLVALRDQTRVIPEDAETCLHTLQERLGASAQTKAPQAVTQSGQLAEALRLAWEETQSAPQKEAISQRYNFYYDIELNRPCIRVYTDYYYDGTEAMGVDFFEYDFMMDEEVRP